MSPIGLAEARAASPRLAYLAALSLALVCLLAPDCCLYGRHAHGLGMYAFGPVCRAYAH